MSVGETLVALMEQDLAITRATRTLDELPEKTAILQLRKRLKEIEVVAEKTRAYCHKAEAMVTRSADEASSVQARIDREQAKILSGDVSNPKELQNLTRELDALKRRKDVIEFEELGLMEKAEAGAVQVAKVEAVLADGAIKEAALIAEYRAHGGALQTEIGHLKAERDRLMTALPADVLKRYLAVRDSKHGIAVGVLTGSMCGACRTQIPAQQAQALRAGPEIGECPNCRRILIVNADQQ